MFTTVDCKICKLICMKMCPVHCIKTWLKCIEALLNRRETRPKKKSSDMLPFDRDASSLLSISSYTAQTVSTG